jgi:hypothetical protein
MKIPDRIENISVWIHTEIKGKEKFELVFGGLKSAVNRVFWEQGYDVSDTFGFSSDNGYKGRFYIIIRPSKENGDSLIDIVDDELAKKYPKPTLEILTIEMIKAIRNRDGLPYAFVYRSDIPGLDFLENYIVKDDMDVYIVKYDHRGNKK